MALGDDRPVARRGPELVGGDHLAVVVVLLEHDRLVGEVLVARVTSNPVTGGAAAVVGVVVAVGSAATVVVAAGSSWNGVAALPADWPSTAPVVVVESPAAVVVVSPSATVVLVVARSHR